ncbi:MAG: DUF134 domain-containing protein [Thermoanaerobacteraceae bacterium]|nr:DUF134 domain-containing protein [Thermoanaerobacteraceae bacterium]
MPRPKKCRKVSGLPKECYFKPAGIPVRELEEINLLVEELEALRLKDLEGLNQEECAGQMNVSRPTFQRILTSAREKVATALVHGRAIKVEGGNFDLNKPFYKCKSCHSNWTPNTGHKRKDKCPKCGNKNIEEISG